MSKKRVKKKRSWKKMEISKVKLNPEQAVLSCCDAVAKLQSVGIGQCYIIPPCGGGSGATAS